MRTRTGWLRAVVSGFGSLALLLAPVAQQVSAEPSATATTHVVQPGETLSGIADSVGLDSAALARLNGLGDANVVIVGQILKVPSGSTSPAAAPAPAATTAVPPAPSAPGRTYTVADGDTLWGIAQQLATTTSALVDANKLEDADHLVMGAQLVVPAAAGQASSVVPAAAGQASSAAPAAAGQAASAAAPSPSVAASAGPNAAPARRTLLVSYTVQPGDTLNQIARQFDIKPDTVIQASGLDDPNHLSVGGVLKLPLPGHEHVVQSGETLRDIAGQEKVDLGSLVDFNALDDPELIRVGQVILVPPAPSLQAAGTGAAGGPTAAPVAPATSPPGAPAADVAAAAQKVVSPAPAAPPPAATPGAPPPASPVAPSDTSAAPDASLTLTASPTPAATAAPAASPTAAKPAPSPTPRPTVPPPAGAPSDGLAGAGLKLLGSAYVWGGSSPSGFDCSGFVWYVARQAGKSLSRGMLGEFNASGAHPSRDDLKPGDLVFFQNTYAAGLSHNGIYIGNGQFVHAADEKAGVTVSSLGTAYWSSHWFGATRLA